MLSLQILNTQCNLFKKKSDLQLLFLRSEIWTWEPIAIKDFVVLLHPMLADMKVFDPCSLNAYLECPYVTHCIFNHLYPRILQAIKKSNCIKKIIYQRRAI